MRGRKGTIVCHDDTHIWGAFVPCYAYGDPAVEVRSNLRVAMLSVPCAVAGWLLLSLITNVALRAK